MRRIAAVLASSVLLLIATAVPAAGGNSQSESSPPVHAAACVEEGINTGHIGFVNGHHYAVGFSRGKAQGNPYGPVVPNWITVCN